MTRPLHIRSPGIACALLALVLFGGGAYGLLALFDDAAGEVAELSAPRGRLSARPAPVPSMTPGPALPAACQSFGISQPTICADAISVSEYAPAGPVLAFAAARSPPGTL